MKVRTAIVLLVLLFSLVPLTVQGLVVNRVMSETLEERALDQLDSVSDIQHSRLHLLLQHDEERFLLIARGFQLRESLLAFQQAPEDDERARHQERLRTLLVGAQSTTDDIRALHLFTANGTLAASTSPREPPARVLEWRDRGADLLVDLVALNRTGVVVIGTAGPVLRDEVRIGTLVVESEGRRYADLVSSYDGLGATGETILVFRDQDGDARFFAPTRFDRDATFRRVTAVEETDTASLMGLRDREDRTVTAVDYRGEVVFASVRHVDELDWALVTKIDRDEALAPTEGLRDMLTVIAAVAAVLSVIFGAMMGIWLLARPVQRSATYADRVRRGESAEAPDTRRAPVVLDEIRALDDSVHAMAQGLQATARYREGLLTATSHALRTPLTPMKLYLYQLEDRAKGHPENMELVRKVKGNLERLEQTVASFVEASRVEAEHWPLQLAPHDVRYLVGRAATRYEGKARDRGVSLDTTLGRPAVVDVDARLVDCAIEYVLEIALRGTPPGGRVDVRTERTEGAIRVLVEDTGPPITEGMEADAFDVFPTLANQERVLGRNTDGLALARRCVELHRGSVWIENRADVEGVRVGIAFPIPKRR